MVLDPKDLYKLTQEELETIDNLCKTINEKIRHTEFGVTVNGKDTVCTLSDSREWSQAVRRKIIERYEEAGWVVSREHGGHLTINIKR